ncbi:transglycosylase family protein [Streptomyces sp. NPDC056144]|uniref:LysM peptidoglycan-binding domain-containing protein n=1 Tax=unclassified Streptomyces TaxID=2593676 RepID=UPI0035DE076F
MRSGNGRHRRPRQAPALVVAAGVTGSAMALPLLATGSASAADAATWDRVAECESGSQWSANFGNGMYGGLQFTQESWERNGGLAYAPSPDLASRAQQIAVADKAFVAGGTDWATCAPIAGLKKDGKATGVDPGPATPAERSTGPVAESNRTSGAPSAATATPSDTPSTGTSAGTPSGAGSRTPVTPERSVAPAIPVTPVTPATPDASATPDSPATSVTPGTSTPPATPGTPGTPGTGKPSDPDAPGTPTAPVAPDASVTPVAPGAPTTPVTPGTPESPGVSPGDAASVAPGTGKHRGEPAPEESGTTDKTGTADVARSATDASKDSGTTDSQGASDAYTVRPGDNLSEIAQENELPGGWNALYDANRGTVGADPDHILPGQSLDLTVGSESKGE